MMRKLMLVLLLCLLPLTALADGPSVFSDALCGMDSPAFAARCEAALATSSLADSALAIRDQGEIVLVRDEYEAFAVMMRSDGLLMLCHFVPAGEDVALHWHNDLLLSSYQSVALSTGGVRWSGGSLPLLQLDDETLRLQLDQEDGTRLLLTCQGYSSYEPWRVTGMALCITPDGERWHTALELPRDYLADDIYLATCTPHNWRRGEIEEGYYGW